MFQPALKYYTEEEYLAMERVAEEKHEYYNGEIFAMSGASFKHNKIENNLRGFLFNHLNGKGYEAYGANLRVNIPANSLYTYPDISIVCDKPKFADEEFDTLVNPAVIIEILPPSTANYDRGAKFDLYREIESLKEYILIDSNRAHFVHYNRNNDNTWTLYETKNMQHDFFISVITFKTPLSEIYTGVEI